MADQIKKRAVLRLKVGDYVTCSNVADAEVLIVMSKADDAVETTTETFLKNCPTVRRWFPISELRKPTLQQIRHHKAVLSVPSV